MGYRHFLLLLICAGYVAAMAILLCAGISDWKTRTVSNKYPLALITLGAALLIIKAFYSSGTPATESSTITISFFKPVMEFKLSALLSICGLLVPFITTPVANLITKHFTKSKTGGADIKIGAAIGFIFGIFGYCIISVISQLIFTGYAVKKHSGIWTIAPICSILAAGSCCYVLACIVFLAFEIVKI